MPRLLAYVPRDAWAFVQDGDQTVCVFPPFLAASRRVVAPAAVASGIAQHGYIPLDAPEESWPEVIARIRAEAHRGIIPTTAETFAAQALASLPVASVEILVRRIEAMALDPRETEASQRALERMAEHERIRTDATLFEVVRDALHRVRATLDARLRARHEATLPPRILAQRNDPTRQRRRAAILNGRASLAA